MEFGIVYPQTLPYMGILCENQRIYLPQAIRHDFRMYSYLPCLKRPNLHCVPLGDVKSVNWLGIKAESAYMLEVEKLMFAV